jgi:hypothetical protein
MTDSSIYAYDEFTTNIKNLPAEGEYMTEKMYSDTVPFIVVSRTAKTLKLIEVRVERDPDWQPNIFPGGFCGHCTNQCEQTWLYAGLGEREVTVRLVKYGRKKIWVYKSLRFIANGANRFYDYNF